MTALSIAELSFRYDEKLQDVVRIKKFDLDKGQRVFLHGPSGSGKSTLLGLVGGLYKPQVGHVEVLGQNLIKMTQSERDRFRAQHIGFIFQVFNLVPYLNVLENVVLPAQFGRGVSGGFNSSRDEALDLLNKLGLGSLTTKPVTQLSIGQQQRVAVARALLGSPGLIIADEPTSALDHDTRVSFLETLTEHAQREGSTVIFVSHDQSLASMFDRSVALKDINQVSIAPGGEP
jgi:putative ABC transport system ATP-binding protein